MDFTKNKQAEIPPKANLLEQMNEFSKVAGYKVDAQKSPYINNQPSEKEI